MAGACTSRYWPRARRSGATSYRIGGSRPKLTIGPYPEIGIADARDKHAELRALVAKEGRPAGAVGLALRVTVFGEGAPAKADDGERRLFSGQPAEIAADIRTLRDLGVGHLDFGFAGGSVDEMLGEMQRFRREVLPKI